MDLKKEITKFVETRAYKFPITLCELAEDLFEPIVDCRDTAKQYSKEELINYLMTNEDNLIVKFRSKVADLNKVYDSIFNTVTYKDILGIGYAYWIFKYEEDFVMDGPIPILDAVTQKKLFKALRQVIENAQDDRLSEALDMTIQELEEYDGDTDDPLEVWHEMENTLVDSYGIRRPDYFIQALVLVPEVAKQTSLRIIKDVSNEYHNFLREWCKITGQQYVNHDLPLINLSDPAVKEDYSINQCIED